MSNPANEAIVKSMYDNYLKGNVPGVVALFADDIEWDEPGAPYVPFGGNYKGMAGIQELFGKQAELVTVSSFEPGAYFSNDNQVVVIGKDSATVNATKKPYDSEWVMVYTITDGKISRIQSYMDTAIMAAAFQP